MTVCYFPNEISIVVLLKRRFELLSVRVATADNRNWRTILGWKNLTIGCLYVFSCISDGIIQTLAFHHCVFKILFLVIFPSDYPHDRFSSKILLWIYRLDTFDVEKISLLNNCFTQRQIIKHSIFIVLFFINLFKAFVNLSLLWRLLVFIAILCYLLLFIGLAFRSVN